MHKLVHLSLVKPNPFRNLGSYPVSEYKIDELVASMERTGFWDNVVARPVNGHYELAYGHHRLIAYRRKYGDDNDINLIIKEIADDDMIRMMADENSKDYNTSAEIEQETIKAVVQAYADGKIELKKPQKNLGGSGIRKGTRFAPHFTPGYFKKDKIANSKPYNAESIAHFLGWWSGNQVAPAIREALAQLEAIELHRVASDDLKGLTRQQASAVVVQAKRVEKANVEAGMSLDDAREVAKDASKCIASKLRLKGGVHHGNENGIGMRDVDKVADKFIPPEVRHTEKKSRKYDYSDGLWEALSKVDEFVALIYQEVGQLESDTEVDYGKMLDSEKWDKTRTLELYRKLDAHLDDMTRLRQQLGKRLSKQQRTKQKIKGG